MYPDERSLVSRLKDEPFALVGINSDPAERYRATVEREGITWPSFWDGGNPQGPIATKWGIRAWPTIFVLDHDGTIRARNVRGERLEEVVDSLLGEMEGRTKGDPRHQEGYDHGSNETLSGPPLPPPDILVVFVPLPGPGPPAPIHDPEMNLPLFPATRAGRW